jgi:hypothetical protein
MSRLRLSLPVLLAVALAGCGLAHVPARQDSGSLNIRWREDFETARREAAAGDHPILAVLVAGELKDEC